MTELILAFTVGILLISLPIGIYSIRQQQKLIKSLENRIIKEQIESHTRVKLLEQRYDKLFALQNANLEKATQQLQENTDKNLNEVENIKRKVYKNFIEGIKSKTMTEYIDIGKNITNRYHHNKKTSEPKLLTQNIMRTYFNIKIYKKINKISELYYVSNEDNKKIIKEMI